jgi:hypothetical protein
MESFYTTQTAIKYLEERLVNELMNIEHIKSVEEFDIYGNSYNICMDVYIHTDLEDEDGDEELVVGFGNLEKNVPWSFEEADAIDTEELFDYLLSHLMNIIEEEFEERKSL